MHLSLNIFEFDYLIVRQKEYTCNHRQLILYTYFRIDADITHFGSSNHISRILRNVSFKYFVFNSQMHYNRAAKRSVLHYNHATVLNARLTHNYIILLINTRNK